MSKASHVTSTPSVDRRSILAGAAGVAAAGGLSAIPVQAMPTGPSPEFLELRRLAKVWDEAVGIRQELLEGDPATPAAEARQDEVEKQINAVEERVMNKPPGDLLDRAALILFWSGGGQRGFDAPVEALRLQAREADCFESRALLLAASVFEMAAPRLS